MPGDNNDRKRCVFLDEMCLHIEPVHVGHVQIENDAIGKAHIERFQKLRT